MTDPKKAPSGSTVGGGAHAKTDADEDEEKGGNGVPWTALFAMAGVLVLVYFVFAFLSFARADDATITEPLWSRSVFVLLGVESIAFTAVGWLFGREVHRGEAQVAKEQAKDAKGTQRPPTTRPTRQRSPRPTRGSVPPLRRPPATHSQVPFARSRTTRQPTPGETRARARAARAPGTSKR